MSVGPEDNSKPQLRERNQKRREVGCHAQFHVRAAGTVLDGFKSSCHEEAEGCLCRVSEGENGVLRCCALQQMRCKTDGLHIHATKKARTSEEAASGSFC